MANLQKQFLAESETKATDSGHRKKINFSLKQSHDAFERGKKQFADLQTARRVAKNIKWNAIENMDIHLLRFEEIITANGGKVIWAEDEHQAQAEILRICKEKQAKTIVKSKSMVTEEIHLNKFLSGHNIEVIETDLGEYIQQLDGEPPYHIVAPAMHKSKEDVAELFHQKLNVAPGLAPAELTMVAREKLRKKYTEAEIGITGANFILADIGGIAVTENEGNARLSTSFPKTHIVVAGIEKLLPSVTDLHLFWPLLATHGSGQKITVYNSIFTGPKAEGEIDGPEDMYVILIDNGRTDILADPKARESLFCIRCGACLNVCPVYKNIGGHTYNATYSGPIGAVITPYLKGLGDYKHLSYASTLCGNCTEVCPVKINLHELLLENRHNAVTEGKNTGTEKLAWQVWKQSMMSRTLMNLAGGKAKNLVIRTLFSSTWGKNRALPVFPARSFNQQWNNS